MGALDIDKIKTVIQSYRYFDYELLDTDFGIDIHVFSKYDKSTRFNMYVYNDDITSIYLSNLFVNNLERKNGIGNTMLKIHNDIAKILGYKYSFLKVTKKGWLQDWYKRHAYLFVKEHNSNMIWMMKHVQ